MKALAVVACAGLSVVSAGLARQTGDPACDRLASLALAGGAVTAAETHRDSPASCRLAATLTPTRDSEIKIEVWLPASGWNRKCQAVGNGAFSGSIATAAMRAALLRGYAAASTDTGHSGGSASFALGHPDKVVDFGWRAVHDMTVAAKSIVAAYYGAVPKQSYWVGCSAGGRQAMMEAQRFPGDFDGIVSGAPGLDWTGRAAQAVRIAKLLEVNEAARLLAAQRQRLHAAVLPACDAQDGVRDGLIENPAKFRVDPGAASLTAPHSETARQIYASPLNPKSKRPITGLAPGSELGWTDLGWTA